MRPRAVPISFADLELQRQRLDVDVVLQQIGQVLDQQRDLIALVRQDLLRDLRKPHTGREGLTAEQTLRATASPCRCSSRSAKVGGGLKDRRIGTLSG